MGFIYDQCLAISLQDLKNLGFLNSKDNYKEAEVKLYRKDGITESSGTIKIAVSVQVGNSYLDLSFDLNGRYVNQRFGLYKKENNPPNGYHWFITCPDTGSYCNKLYLAGDGFRSRKNIKSGVYKINTFRFGSKRILFNKVSAIERAKKQAARMNKPYSKPYYNGAMTKRNMKAIEAGWKGRVSIHHQC